MPNTNASTIAAENVEVNISDAPKTENAEAQFTFIGTFDKIIWESPTGIYGFTAEEQGSITAGQFVHVGSGASILACRAYLKYEGSSELTGAQTRGISIESLPDKLEIEWLPASSNGGTTAVNDSKRLSTDDAPIYNINGQRVDSSYKGLIIKNGKKVVNK